MNIAYVMENNLSVDDICILSLLDTVAKEKNSDIFQYSYKEIIEDLPLIFKHEDYDHNSKILRKTLDKKTVKNFVNRKIDRKGRHLGSIMTFELNRANMDKLDIEGIVK